MAKHHQNKDNQNNNINTSFREPALGKILRWSVYGVAVVPLIIFKDYISPFHFGKVVVFRSIIEIAAVLYLCLVLKDRSYLPRRNRVFWAFLGFAVAFSLATAFSILPYSSFWGSLERMGGLWTFWHYFVFFVIATTVMRTREHWTRLLDVSVVVGVLSAIYGFGQKTDIEFFVGSGGRSRIFGTIGNPALFAGYQLVNFFLALTLFFTRLSANGYLSGSNRVFTGLAWIVGGAAASFASYIVAPDGGVYFIFSGAIIFGLYKFIKEVSSFRLGLYMCAMLMSSLAILMTVVRGSVMGLGLGLFIFSAMYYMRYRAKWAKFVVTAAVASAALLAIVVLTPLQDSKFIADNRYLQRMTDVNLDSYTAKTRFWAWEAGVNGWKEGPKTVLLGWGPENFNIPFSKYFNPLFFNGPGSETLFDRAHNMFVEILVTMGLVGLLAYLAMFWSAFSALSIIARQKPDQYLFKVGFISLIVAYAIHNAFIFDTSANFIIFFTTLAFISYLLDEATGRLPHGSTKTRLGDGLVGTVGTVLMLGALVLVFNTNISSAEANYSTTRAIVAGWSDDPNAFKVAMDKYKEALRYDIAGKYEYRHRMAQYLLEYSNSRKLSPEIVEALNYAIAEVNKNADENPPDYLPLLYISRMYIMLGKEEGGSPHNDTALKYSGRALELSPTFVRTYYEVAQAYLNKRDFANAIAAFKKAAELNPDVGISFWYWGVTEIEAGNVKEGLAIAQKALEKGYSLGESEYVRLVNIYIKLNDLPKIIEGYEALVGLNPKNPQYQASLAVAYARGGLIDKAAEHARTAAELDPSFEAEARKFIESLGMKW